MKGNYYVLYYCIHDRNVLIGMKMSILYTFQKDLSSLLFTIISLSQSFQNALHLLLEEEVLGDFSYYFSEVISSQSNILKVKFQLEFCFSWKKIIKVQILFVDVKTDFFFAQYKRKFYRYKVCLIFNFKLKNPSFLDIDCNKNA